MKGASRLAAVDAYALTLGLEPGLALADARARIPELKAVAFDAAADRAFLARLAETAYAFTPSVAFEPPHGLVLDITGCAHLFGGEAGLLARLEAALRADGVSVVTCAIAPTPEMARALARFGSPSHKGLRPARGAGPSRSPARGEPLDPLDRGDEAAIVHDNAAVRALPVAALEGDPEDMRALRRAGLKTIGDVASRPSVLFTTRFTPAFTLRLARVLGEEDRRITPLRPPPVTTLEHRCPEPILTTDVVLLILGDLVARTVRLLEERGEGGRLFEVAFFRTDGVIRRLRIETSRPAREPALVLRLVRDRLDALTDPLDPGFGFDLVRLEVLRAEPWSPAQASLDANDEAEEQLAGLIDRLGAMFGRTRVQRLVAADTHIPERAQRLRPAAGVRTPAEAPRTTHEALITRPLHLFEPPQPIELMSGTCRRGATLPHRPPPQSCGSAPPARRGDRGGEKQAAWRSIVTHAHAKSAEKFCTLGEPASSHAPSRLCPHPTPDPSPEGRGDRAKPPCDSRNAEQEEKSACECNNPSSEEGRANSSAPLVRLRWRRVMHDVVRIDGPERIAEEWWRQPVALEARIATEMPEARIVTVPEARVATQGFGTRDYYRVETRDGRRFWIFRAHADEDPAGRNAWPSQVRAAQSEGPCPSCRRRAFTATRSPPKGQPFGNQYDGQDVWISTGHTAQWFLHGVFA